MPLPAAWRANTAVVQGISDLPQAFGTGPLYVADDWQDVGRTLVRTCLNLGNGLLPGASNIRIFQLAAALFELLLPPPTLPWCDGFMSARFFCASAAKR